MDKPVSEFRSRLSRGGHPYCVGCCLECEREYSRDRARKTRELGLAKQQIRSLKPCRICDKEIIATTRTLYCSSECRYKERIKKKLAPCALCLKPFSRWKASRVYCSRNCYHNARRRPKYLKCKVCDAPFKVRKCRRRQYCSHQCKYVGSRKFRECAFCSKQYWHGTGKGKVYCSIRCQARGREVWRSCNRCEKPYRPRFGGKLYCSQACGIAALQEGYPTTIETAVYEALSELGIKYNPQYIIDNFVCDVFIPDRNLIIECQGDYWHCNPARYPNGPINQVQRDGVIRDKRKFAKFAKLGIPVFQIWEADIRSIGAKVILQRLFAEM
jgi:G:T-mismatch repair DNA endonuclease (very short patch repair protein)